MHNGAVTQHFDAAHPEALAVYCSDGRLTLAVEDLCEDLGHERFDTVTLPGGPALLVPAPADLSEVHVFSRATRFLIEGHGIKHVILLAHEGCGFYRSRCGSLADAAIHKMQLAHLLAAREVLLRQHPDLAVACYYARNEGGVITFDEVAR